MRRARVTPFKAAWLNPSGMSVSCHKQTFALALAHEANCPPALIRRGLGHLAVSSGNQTFGDQQKSREYQGVNHRDRDYADGKTTVVVVEISTQYIAKSCHDYIESAGHHEHRSLQSRRTGPNNQVHIGGSGNATHEPDRHRRDQCSAG